MHLYRLEAQGRFPKRFKLGSDAKTGAIGWWQDEVEAWLRQRDQKRQQPAPDQPNAAA
jgi:predicted DNA-binding transcriptional regulator AlpA